MKTSEATAYLRHAANLLGLKDWHVAASSRPLSDDDSKKYEAMVTMTEDRNALIHFCKDFWDKPESKQRSIIAHELCHLHTRRLVTVAERLAATTPKKTRDVFEQIIEDADEHAVESIAQLLARRIMLPSTFVRRFC